MSIIQLNCTQINDGHPKLATAEERFAWLMAVQKITSIFSEKINYDFDPLQLLEEQAKIVEVLRKNPSYSELLSNKKYHEICITPPEGGLVYSDVQIKPEAVEGWKRDLKATQSTLGAQSLEEAIEELLKRLPLELGTSDVLNECIRELTFSHAKNTPKKSRAQKGKVCSESKAYNEAMLSGIRKQNPSNLPQEIINWWEEFRDIDHTLRQHFEVFANEQKLCDLLELWVIVDKEPNLDKLSAEDLIYFSDIQDAIKPKLDAFQEVKNQEALSVRIGKHLNKYASQTTCAAKVANTPIILTQQPPAVAIFRGCVGNDCSSQYSFPYPNDPNESVFYIYGEGRTLKGYVSAVEVMLNNEPALYVITANGSHLSAGDMEMIFQGLEAQKEQLGVKHIVLPNPKNIATLINFPAPKEVYHKYTDGQPLVWIGYKHHDIRQAIESFSSSYNSGSYDHRWRNGQGVIFKPKKKVKLTVEISPAASTIQPQDLSQASPSEIADLLIPMHLIGKDAVMDQMLAIETVAQKVNQVAFKTFLALLENRDRTLSISQWKKSLNASLEMLNIEREFLERRHPEYLYPSMLYRSDSFSAENIENSAKAMVADMRSNDFKPKGFNFSDLSDATLKKLNETSAFKQLIALLTTRLTDENLEVRCAAINALAMIKPEDAAIHQALALRLKDGYWKVGEAAAQALGEIKPTDPEIHQALAAALQDWVWRVAYEAAKALGKIKPADVAIQRELVQLLHYSEPNVSSAAEEALIEIQPTDLAIHQALVALLPSSNGMGGRSQAVRVLSGIKPLSFEIHRALAELLKDLDGEVRRAAVEVLGAIMLSDVEIHHTLAIDQALAKLLKDSNPEMCTYVLGALGASKTADAKIHRAIAEFFQHRDPEICRCAVSAFCVLKPTDVEIPRAITALIKDSHWSIYNEVKKALGAIKPEDAVIYQELAVLLKDPSAGVRERAARVIGAIKPKDASIHQALAVLLQDSDLKVRNAAAEALGEIKPADVKIHQALAVLLQDPETEVRITAAEALGEIKPTDVAIHQALAALLQDPMAYFRNAAVEALGKIKPADVSIHQALAVLLKDPDVCVRATAAAALGKIKPEDEEICRALAELLQDADPEVRAEAAKAMKAIKPTDVAIHRALAALLQDLDLRVVEAAAEALAEIQPEDDEIYQAVEELLDHPILTIRKAAAEFLRDQGRKYQSRAHRASEPFRSRGA